MISNNIYQKIGAACLLLWALGSTSVSAQESSTVDQDSVSHYQNGSIVPVWNRGHKYSNSITWGDTLANTTVPNITNTLYGRLNGLMTMQNGGQPGYDQASMYVRGVGTYDQSSLVCYVDGFQVDIALYFSYLSAGEIENVRLLKDPVSLATFGMKGANGILWVTTKRSTDNKLDIQARVHSGIQQPTNLLKPLSSYQYANLFNQAISNDRYALNGNQFQWAPQYSNEELANFQNGTGTNVDWLDAAMRDAGRYTDANVQFKGGIDETAKYYVFLDYMNHGGLYDVPNTSGFASNSQLSRISMRTNVDLHFFDIFDAKIDLGGRVDRHMHPMSQNNFENANNYWRELTTYPNNIYPITDPATGNWSGNSLYPNNPVAQLNAIGTYSGNERTLQGNFSLRERLDMITKGLYLSQSVSFNTWTRVIQEKKAAYARFFNGQQATADRTESINFGPSQSYGQLTWRQTNFIAGYDRTFRDHSVSAATNFYTSEMLPDANENAANIRHRFQNLATRANYAFKDKYSLDLAFGYSGSDNYAPASRWRFYPAAGFRWTVSNELFLSNVSWLDDLNVYASIGKSANDQTLQGRYLYQQYYQQAGGILTGVNNLIYNGGLQLGRIASPGIIAEESLKKELSVDATLWNRVNVQATWFDDQRSGIITQNNLIPGFLGYTGSERLPLENIGKVTNRGFELNLGYHDRVGDVSYGILLSGTYAKNNIDYQAEVPNKNAFSNLTGNPIGTLFGLTADRLYQLEDFNADGSLKSGIAAPTFGPVQPGDIKYVDLDGDGQIDNNDMSRIGYSTYPQFYYSWDVRVGYKGFSLSALFQGAAKRSVNLLGASYDLFVPFVGNKTAYPVAENAWAYYPEAGIDNRNDATYPRLTTVANENNYINSSYWIKNADFLRLRSLQLQYDLPQQWIENLKLKQAKIMLTAVNPFVWSDFQRTYKLDPETPAGYPAVKSYTAGVMLHF